MENVGVQVACYESGYVRASAVKSAVPHRVPESFVFYRPLALKAQSLDRSLSLPPSLSLSLSHPLFSSFPTPSYDRASDQKVAQCRGSRAAYAVREGVRTILSPFRPFFFSIRNVGRGHLLLLLLLLSVLANLGRLWKVFISVVLFGGDGGDFVELFVGNGPRALLGRVRKVVVGVAAQAEGFAAVAAVTVAVDVGVFLCKRFLITDK